MFKERISALKQTHLYRFLRTVESDQGAEIVFEGKKYLNFSSNNYLGLANHPKLKEAAVRATKEYGTGSGASRLVTGSMSLHKELERRIASFKGLESALLFNSGYHANIGAIPTLVGEGGVIFSDENNHASLIDGCKLSKAETKVYRHNDVGQLEELLRRSFLVARDSLSDERLATSDQRPSSAKASEGRRLIITDSIFSMNGNLCDLPKIMDLAEKYDAMVYIDEAHATGVFGKRGRGVVEHFGIDPRHPRLIHMGTFGKALGSFGAFVCGSSKLIDYLINHARSFIYTTALPPGVLAASVAAIDLISEDLSYKEKLWENVGYFRKNIQYPKPNIQKNTLLGIGDWDLGFNNSPIFPIVIGDSKKTMEISSKLFEKGIWAQGIRPPSVPEGAARIRLTLMATHTKNHLNYCLDVIKHIV